MVLFSSTGFGLKCLSLLVNMSSIQVQGVVTIPKHYYLKHNRNSNSFSNANYADFFYATKKYNIPVMEYISGLNYNSILNAINKWKPDLIVAVGWYYKVNEDILNIPHKGVVGLHSSLLPNYSGGAPLVWAIINGEIETGITLFFFDGGIDSGDIIGQRKVPIYFHDNIATLYKRIEVEGLKLLMDHMPKFALDDVNRTPQQANDRTIFPQRLPENGFINWGKSALEIYNFIRAQTKPYPGAFTYLNRDKITIWSASIANIHVNLSLSCGELRVVKNHNNFRIFVGARCGDSPIEVHTLGVNEIDISLNEFIDKYFCRSKQSLNFSKRC